MNPMMKKAVFPGSFDPITNGHMDIIQRALPLFDEIVVAIGTNSQKRSLFSLEQRMEWLESLFGAEPRITIAHFEGLTLNYCRNIAADYLIRGIRNAADFDYERTISQINYTVTGNLETVFFIARPELSHVSSTIVRELVLGKGDVSAFVPEALLKNIHQYAGRN